jgi:hypothetical protein
VCRSLLFELPADGKTRAFATKAAGRLVLRLDFLKNGGFASARILLRRAAESGNADAALLLGKTFDPVTFVSSAPLASSPILHGADSGTQKPPNLALKPPPSD